MMSRIHGLTLQIWFLITAPFQRDLITDTARSIYQIDFVSLKKQGISLVIFDLDDTLAHWRASISQEVMSFLNSLHNDIGMSIAILTNSTMARGKKIKKTLDLDHVVIMQTPTKPLTGGYIKILLHYNTPADKTAMIGDRLATDMWGAKRAGIKTRILVEPCSNHMQNYSSFFVQKLIRALERTLYGNLFFAVRNNKKKSEQNSKNEDRNTLKR